MLFTDTLFLPFLLAVFLLWLPWGASGRKLVLIAASLVFYACWDVRFLAPLALVWLVLHLSAFLLRPEAAPSVRRRWLTAGIVLLVGQLFVHKYFDFFLASLRPLWGGEAQPGPALRLILPVGISFYTFQAISYLVDAYRGKLSPSRSPLDTALYASFFPLLFAGPIEKGSRWLPQIAAHHPLRWENVRQAMERMLLGYLLKVAVADPIAPFAADIFARAGGANSGELAAGALLYSLQIFTDFAGYSLIARGVARLFGYEVINNFEQPYFSRSFSEFWRRWHISLSTWIWEYLFNPLMSVTLRRVGRLGLPTVEKEMRIAYPLAVIATMLLCGLWHGAGWTFVVWGGLHGFFLAFERVAIFGNRPVRKWPRLSNAGDLARALGAGTFVFALCTLAWVVFRADSLGDAVVYLQRLFTAGGWVVQKKTLLLLGVGIGVTLLVTAVEYRRRDEWVFSAVPGWARGAAWAAAVLVVIVLGGAGGKVPFIYFQF